MILVDLFRLRVFHGYCKDSCSGCEERGRCWQHQLKSPRGAETSCLLQGLSITAGMQGKQQLPSLLMLLEKVAGAVKPSPAVG